jgi:hypothetical protein
LLGNPSDYQVDLGGIRREGSKEKVKLIKMFGFAALAAVVAMALVGATSASAKENTQLCKVHQEPCAAGNAPTSVHFVAGTTVLKTSIITVLCLASLVVATPLGLGTAPTPQVLHNTEITWSNCGTNPAHNNCTVTTLAPGLVDLLKTALNLGTATVLGAEVKVVCGEILNCTYGGAEVTGFTSEGALHTAGAGHGMLTASELTVPVVGGLLCPATSKWNALYEPLEHLYIVG